MSLGTPCTVMCSGCLGSGRADTSHYPHPGLVPMGVTLWGRPAYRELPGTEESLKAWDGGRPQGRNSGEPKRDINDVLSPWPSVSPSCPRKGCFCCTASTCPLSFLLTVLSLSHLSPESFPFCLSTYWAGHQDLPQSRPLLPSRTSCSWC